MSSSATSPAYLSDPPPFPIRLLAVVMGVTWVGILGLGYGAYSLYQADDRRHQEDGRAAHLQSVIRHHDEVLTMSAWMAAGTGNQEWEARYRQFEPILDRAITDAVDLARQRGTHSGLKATEEANRELVKLETRVFELVRKGNLQEARAILSGADYSAYKQKYLRGVERFSESADLATRLRRLQGEILRLDEVLTMSARLAAATGEDGWEALYRTHEPMLLQAIADALALAPGPSLAQALDRTQQANDALVELENQGFDLVRKGRSAEAMSLLTGEAYSSHKQTYSDGMDTFGAGLLRVAEAEDEARAWGHRVRMGIGVIVLVVLTGGLARLSMGIQTWRRVLSRSFGETRHAHEALSRAHAELEDRVRERTGELRDANEKLRGEMEERARLEESRSQMEIQLRQSHKLEAVGQLAAGIAHEINTPIQYVGDNLKFLEDAYGGLRTALGAYEKFVREGDGAAADLEGALRQADLEYLQGEVPKALQQSMDGVDRVSKIVRAMKEFSHPGKAEKTPTDLNRAIETTVTVARSEWKYAADLDCDLDPDLPAVSCVPGEINQVLLNLIVNAAHAVEAANAGREGVKGRITLRTRKLGDQVEIRVEDTGTGIRDEHRERVFAPFFTTKEVGKGSGQGLTLARNTIVNAHGGTLEFETEVGKGTTFIIQLPVNSGAGGAA